MPRRNEDVVVDVAAEGVVGVAHEAKEQDAEGAAVPALVEAASRENHVSQSLRKNNATERRRNVKRFPKWPVRPVLRGPHHRRIQAWYLPHRVLRQELEFDFCHGCIVIINSIIIALGGKARRLVWYGYHYYFPLLSTPRMALCITYLALEGRGCHFTV